MAVSEYFSNAELLSELRVFVDINEEDLQSCLNTITEVDEETMEIKVLNRTFQFNKRLCGVEEVE